MQILEKITKLPGLHLIVALKNLKSNLSRSSLPDFLFLLFLAVTIGLFLLLGVENTANILTDSKACLALFFLILAAVFCYWLVLLSQNRPNALIFARISLTPFSILALLIPHHFFYTQLKGLQPLGCLGIVFLGTILFNRILNNTQKTVRPKALLWAAIILLMTYIFYFSAVSVLRHLNYQNINPFDVGLYSQIQWNNLHGRFFQSSMSGSNFATHNSPFLILLTPFYAAYPRPETLLIVKTLFLALSAIPFYLISKRAVHENALLPLALAYLFSPFIVGQNFNAPHEICFLPPFLLLSFYFFQKNDFRNFLIFLLISLSVKEHLALIAVMYGLYAIYLRREMRWAAAPILLGIAWGIFSIWLIDYFRTMYQVDRHPAWLIDNIKNRFFRPDMPAWQGFVSGIQTSNLGGWHGIFFVYLLLSPGALILPFFSPVVLLGLPELLINLLSSVTLIYPVWHYNIAATCFVMLACVEAIKRLASITFFQKWGLAPAQTQALLAWFLCLCVMSHFFLWWDYTEVKPNVRYVGTMNAALRLVPREASVTLSKHLAAYVSDRKDYFLHEDTRKGDYIVLDANEDLKNSFKDNGRAEGYAEEYVEIFQKDGIRVYRKKFYSKNYGRLLFVN